MPTDQPIVAASALTRVHSDGSRDRYSLDDVSLTVDVAEVVAVMGPSGSGKTTLLHLLGGLDAPDSGQVLLQGTDWQLLHGDERARFRRRTCGFVVQGFALLPQATAAENIEVPLLLDGVAPDVRRERVAAALGSVGMTAEGAKIPDQLSGGQQQRVAIARALINEPALILADEPTGNLDSANAETVVQLLLDSARDRRASVVLVTHDPAIARRADRVVQLRSGRVADGEPAIGPGGE